MGKRAQNIRNIWTDVIFINEIREIKHTRSLKDKKEYSDGDITRMIVEHPIFKELKKGICEEDAVLTASLRFQMDRKRIK